MSDADYEESVSNPTFWVWCYVEGFDDNDHFIEWSLRAYWAHGPESDGSWHCKYDAIAVKHVEPDGDVVAFECLAWGDVYYGGKIVERFCARAYINAYYQRQPMRSATIQTP